MEWLEWFRRPEVLSVAWGSIAIWVAVVGTALSVESGTLARILPWALDSLRALVSRRAPWLADALPWLRKPTVHHTGSVYFGAEGYMGTAIGLHGIA